MAPGAVVQVGGGQNAQQFRRTRPQAYYCQGKSLAEETHSCVSKSVKYDLETFSDSRRTRIPPPE